MLYSAWGRDGSADMIVAGMSLPEQIRRIDPGLTLIRTFEARNYDEAMRQFNEANGRDSDETPPKIQPRRLAGVGA